jgi:hypothetical protein
MLSERKTVRRSVAIAFGIICVVVVAGLVGAFAYYHYTPIISGKDNTISSLNAEISQLNATTLLNLREQVEADNLTIQSLTNQLASVQDQFNGLLNVTVIPLGLITSNISVWVNRTVIVEGYFTLAGLTPPFEYRPWNYLLSSGGQFVGVIGVSLSAHVNMSQSFWNQVGSDPVGLRIHGVVKKGEIWYFGNVAGGDTYYIEAETVEPL